MNPMQISDDSDFDDEVSTTTLSQDGNEETSDKYSACGGVYIQKQFVLESPNYPEKYPPDLECHYLLKGPHCPTSYEFNFLDFQLEDSANCTKDKLEIEDQGALCGNQNEIKTYFSEDGSLHLRFKSDDDASATGYRIQVTRMACNRRQSRFEEEGLTTEYFETTTTEDVTEEVTNPIIQSRSFPNFAQSETECCTNNYKAKRFVVTSPNFPYTLNKETECIYQIHKANDNVCRLRLNFLAFWLGYTNFNNYCPYGFLEIDGKHICGCNKDLKLTTTFGDSDVKILRFKTGALIQNYNTGFVLEVIQDECPKKYSPENLHKYPRNGSKEFGLYNDQVNRVAWPQENFLQKLQLINERTEILDDDDVYTPGKPTVVKSVYFFAAPEYNDIPSLIVDKEKTTYVDTRSIDSIVTNTNYQECFNWNQINFNDLITRYGETLQQTCKSKENNQASTATDNSCVELNNIRGYFRSPGYPCYYPGNLNLCYRFKKQPGYCAIRIFMNDFQIENSQNCQKDYVLLTNGYKHCGNSLFKASWTMDMQHKDYEYMRFVTDAYYCGRGLSGVYEQIQCQDPVDPIIPSTTPVIPTTSRPVYCDRFIREKSFTMEVSDDHEICTFRIEKSSKDVCKITFYFEKFDLFCAEESLVIDGMMFCGHLTGRVVTMNINRQPKNIVYRSTLQNKYDNLRFKIRGEQVTDDCLIPDVPAQRLIKSLDPPSSTNINEDFSQTQTNEEEKRPENSTYTKSLVSKQFKDICGIVSNTPDSELPTKFCDMLISKHNAARCVPLTENLITVPGKPQEKMQFEVKLKNTEKIAEYKGVEFNEIDCDKLIE